MMKMDDRCGICDSDEPEQHQLDEANGVIHHRWSIAGDLVPVDRRPQKQRQQPPITVIRSVDTSLRRLLMEKGVLTDEDIATLFNFDLGIARDRETGPTKGTE